MNTVDKHFRDFEVYSRALIASGDVDPVYPFVSSIIQHYGFEPEWFIFCYSTFYSLESAIKMCEIMPTRHDWDAAKFLKLRESGKLHHFNHERRGSVRIPSNQVVMFDAIVEFIEAVHDHIGGRVESPLLDSNIDFRQNLMTLPFHGEWSSFKIAELFEKSLGYSNLAILDLGLDGKDPNKNDGPIGGLRWLYGRDNQYTKDIYPIWNKYGENLAKAWGVGMGEVETCFCKWHKMVSGKYWVGHDIAEFVDLKKIMEPKLYESIMAENFDDSLWEGLDAFPKHQRKIYKDKGIIINDGFANNYPKIDALQILMETE